MKIVGKIKKLFSGRKAASGKNVRKDVTDAEISAEEVAREELFPAGRRSAAQLKKDGARTARACGKSASDDGKARGKSPVPKPKKPRTRPTNPDYRMIDTDDGTSDTSKS